MMKSLGHCAAVAVVASLVVGCPSGPPPTTTSRVHPTYVNLTSPQTLLSGVAYDPEALYFTYTMCGPPCQMFPIGWAASPLLGAAAVAGATIGVIDPPSPTALATGTSNFDGTFGFSVTASPAPLFPTSSGGALAQYQGPPIPLAQATTYVPTYTYRPIITTESGTCTTIDAVSIGKNGILDAVARYRTAHGTTTSVADLINPAKFGGVIISWLYQPNLPLTAIPADSTQTVASAGTVYQINWDTPGMSSQQSARGFFVVQGATTSPLGLSVILVPNGTSSVQLTPVDTVTDPASQRPWQAMPFQVSPIPGMVLFAGTYFGQTGSLPPEVCQ